MELKLLRFVLGVAVFITILYMMSNNRQIIKFRYVLQLIFFQILIAYFLLASKIGVKLLILISNAFNYLMDYGDSLKWAAPNQRLIWEADDADIILKELNL